MLPNEKAKEIKQQVSLIDFLARLGFQPHGKPGRETKYLSMLRDSDSDPSFSVNDSKGLWRDYGSGQGGNIIDFALLYFKGLTFNEALDKIAEVCALDLEDASKSQRSRLRPAVKIPHYLVQSVKPYGSNNAINSYLKTRGVFEAAAGRVQEVYYYVEDEKKQRKEYFAAGWKNELGGWEIRNKYFKGCLGKKAISFIAGDSRSVAVFEGYLDYLSWVTENPLSTKSVIVLNSLVLLDAAIEKAKGFSEIDLFMDRDKPGFQAARDFQKALPYARDCSTVYDGFNDYNDKLKASLKEERVKNLLQR